MILTIQYILIVSRAVKAAPRMPSGNGERETEWNEKNNKKPREKDVKTACFGASSCAESEGERDSVAECRGPAPSGAHTC